MYLGIPCYAFLQSYLLQFCDSFQQTAKLFSVGFWQWLNGYTLRETPLLHRSQCDKIWQNSPLFRIFKNLWQYIKGLFGFGQSFQLTLAQFVCIWANFHCCKWLNIENTFWSSGHTDWGLRSACTLIPLKVFDLMLMHPCCGVQTTWDEYYRHF